MFKVGDKVVRKAKDIQGFWTTSGLSDKPVTITKVTRHTGNYLGREDDIKIEGNESTWCSKYFDLYVEPVATPTPKFKVDDKVIFTNAKKKKHETKIKGVFVAYEVEVNKGTILVKEERLSNPPPIPREITVDGVVYREVL